MSNSHIKLSTYANVGHTLYIRPESMSNINDTNYFGAEDTSDGMGSVVAMVQSKDMSIESKV